MTRGLVVLVALALFLASCSEARQARYRTRYIPPVSALDYDHDYEQLPHQPPALDGNYRPGPDDQAYPRTQVNDLMLGIDTFDSGDSFMSYAPRSVDGSFVR
ncbi:MAG: hypothetical protein ACOCXJ_03680 [Planctomycetota bacterium]